MKQKKRMERVQKAIDALNDALDRDPQAMQALIRNKIPCNELLADHPTIPVDCYSDGKGGHYVSALGLIVGVIKSMGYPLIAVECDTDRKGICEMKEFRIYEYQPPN